MRTIGSFSGANKQKKKKKLKMDCSLEDNTSEKISEQFIKGTLSPEKTLTNCIHISTIDRYRYFIPKC